MVGVCVREWVFVLSVCGREGGREGGRRGFDGWWMDGVGGRIRWGNGGVEGMGWDG